MFYPLPVKTDTHSLALPELAEQEEDVGHGDAAVEIGVGRVGDQAAAVGRAPNGSRSAGEGHDDRVGAIGIGGVGQGLAYGLDEGIAPIVDVELFRTDEVGDAPAFKDEVGSCPRAV